MDGILLGADVGASDGNVGWTVGALLGGTLGKSVGVADGEVDGTPVGSNVGHIKFVILPYNILGQLIVIVVSVDAIYTSLQSTKQLPKQYKFINVHASGDIQLILQESVELQ